MTQDRPEAPETNWQGALPSTSDALNALMRLAGRPKTFERYKLEGEIARGGMGAILRVYDQDLQRHLAMKVILGQAEAQRSGATPPLDSRHVARFLEEAQVTSQLDHPGIVPVHEIGLDDQGAVYFTMKLVKGKTLKDVFDERAAGTGEWSEPRVLGLILKVCEAMAYAHHKGVIHRDLKPSNVMVGRFGEVFVMDWGLARLLDKADEKDLRVRPAPAATSTLHSDRRVLSDQSPDSPLVTMDGDVVGTPAYMSPEQAAGRVGEIGPQADVYAVGAMLYQMLAGHMPYVPPGALVHNHAIWQRVQEGPPPAIETLAPSSPAELAAICAKAMARDPRERYRDMREIADDLRAFVEGRVVKAYEAGAWAEARKWLKRNRTLAAALAASALFALIALVAVTWSWQEARRDLQEADSALEAKRAAIAEADRQLASIQEELSSTRSNLVKLRADVAALDSSAQATSDMQARIDLVEQGAQRAEDLARTVREVTFCPTCDGDGKVVIDCRNPNCNGGWVYWIGDPPRKTKCTACNGTTKQSLRCPTCKGTGRTGSVPSESK